MRRKCLNPPKHIHAVYLGEQHLLKARTYLDAAHPPSGNEETRTLMDTSILACLFSLTFGPTAFLLPFPDLKRPIGRKSGGFYLLADTTTCPTAKRPVRRGNVPRTSELRPYPLALPPYTGPTLQDTHLIDVVYCGSSAMDATHLPFGAAAVDESDIFQQDPEKAGLHLSYWGRQRARAPTYHDGNDKRKGNRKECPGF